MMRRQCLGGYPKIFDVWISIVRHFIFTCGYNAIPTQMLEHLINGNFDANTCAEFSFASIFIQALN